jgi:hypothetical protein
MLRLQMIGLALVVALAMSALVSASAFAAHEWLLNGAAITTAVKIKSKSVGGLLLEDLKATGGAVAILCEGEDKGTVGPGAKDEVTSITANNCSFEKNGQCEAGQSVTANALHLPWKTTLELVSGELRDVVMGTGGEPGWNVECTVLKFFKVQDECTGLTSTGIHNDSTGVLAIFDSKTPLASCTNGGANAGMVKGTDLNENPTGGTISSL